MPKRAPHKLPFIILAFLVITTLTILFSSLKVFLSQTNDVYVKINISQGLWWSTTTKPSHWFTQAFKIGDQALNLLGQPIAEITDFVYYPEDNKHYNITVTVKLSTKYSPKNKTYQFDRSQLAVGSPINIDFPTSQLTGTIIDFSPNPITNPLVEKTVVLEKRGFNWELNAIPLGDKYFNGNQNVFEIIDKQAINTLLQTYDSQNNPLYYQTNTISVKNITITAKIMFKENGGRLFFGENQLATPGGQLAIITPNFDYSYFVITKIY